MTYRGTPCVHSSFFFSSWGDAHLFGLKVGEGPVELDAVPGDVWVLLFAPGEDLLGDERVEVDDDLDDGLPDVVVAALVGVCGR